MAKMEPLNQVNIMNNKTDNVGLFLTFKHIPAFMYRELPIVYNLTGTVFNAILITYFIKTRKYSSPTFMLLTSMAFMDAICCFSGALWSAFLFPTMLIPEVGVGCQTFMFIGAFGLCASEYHLVFFAALRFYQLAFPLAAKAKVTSTFVLKICLIIMFLMSVYELPFAVLYGTKSVIIGGNRVTICTLSAGRYAYDISMLIINTIFPCVAISLLHIAKYIAVWRSMASIVSEQQNRQNSDARAVTIIIILFFIAWFPSHVYSNIQHTRVENYKKMRDSMYLVLMYNSFSNSTLNPLVYCFAAKTVRDDVLKLIHPRGQRNKPAKNH